MRRILFIINSPIIGGAERHTISLAKGLEEYGFEAEILALKPGPAGSPKSFNNFKITFPSKPGYFGQLAEVKSRLANNRIDMVFAVNQRPCLVAALSNFGKDNGGIAAVGVLHSTRMRNWKELALQIAHYPFFRSLTAIIFISHLQKAFWNKWGLRPSNSTVILNGINPERYSPAIRAQYREDTRKYYGWAPNDYVIAISAVMRPEKNHGQLLRVFSQLKQKGISAKLLMIGDGPKRQELEVIINSMGLTKDVSITGFVDDVRPHVAAADVGVICSTAIETLSLAALEIMGMGLPMVMSDIGGAAEIVDASCGRLFPSGDDSGLLSALVDFADPSLRNQAGAAASRVVKERFDERVMFAAYANYLNEVIEIHSTKQVRS